MPDPQYVVVVDNDAIGFFDTDAGALAWMMMYTLKYSPKNAKVCQFTSPPPQIEMSNEEKQS